MSVSQLFALHRHRASFFPQFHSTVHVGRLTIYVLAPTTLHIYSADKDVKGALYLHVLRQKIVLHESAKAADIMAESD